MSGDTGRGTMPCGHPRSMVVTGDEGTSYCRGCEAAAPETGRTLEQRLRAGADISDAHAVPEVASLLREAAAELDRLRSEREKDEARQSEVTADYVTQLEALDAERHAAEAEAARYQETLEAIREKAFRENLEWMHFHETAIADPFKAESEAQAFAKEIAALAGEQEQT